MAELAAIQAQLQQILEENRVLCEQQQRQRPVDPTGRKHDRIGQEYKEGRTQEAVG